MAFTRKDAAATVFTALAVLVFAAAHQGWGVPLVGDSYRWAAGAIGLLGIGACAQGETGEKGAASGLLSLLGAAALALVVLTFVTGSLTALSLLVADVVVLWTASTLRHGLGTRRAPAAA